MLYLKKMLNKLYYNTVTPYLRKILVQLMGAKVFDAFRLVGGTSLSLQKGHRLSVDIDLFTDSKYGSLNFNTIDKYLHKEFPYIETSTMPEIGMGKSYFIGKSEKECIKLDIYYTDSFIKPAIIADKIRLASVEDIIAMKLEIIGSGGRKKDFWDIHELINDYSFNEMIELYKKRCPFGVELKILKKQFSNFEIADEEPDPVCLKGKIWELIKLDLVDFVKHG